MSKMKQNKPGKDYFDEIEEVGQSKSGSGQTQRLRRNITSYDPVRSDESEGDELSEFSDVDGDVEPPKTVLRFVRASSPNGECEVKPEIPSPVLPPDEDDEYFGAALKRSRRKSATRSPIITLNVDQEKSKSVSANVDGVSILAKSSIANRIRVKVAQISNSIPSVFRKKKKRDYKLQFFVALMFLVIILLVGSIYVIHQEKELQKAYFDRIRFSWKERRIRVSNLKEREVLSGILGMSLTSKDKAWECLAENQRDSGTCVEWMNIARLYFRGTNPRKDWDPANYKMECYEIVWQSLSSSFVPQDCFHIGENKGFYFYGGGELDSNQWPLHRTSIPLSPFITGSKISGHGKKFEEFEWGRTIRRFFVGSPGVAIEISKQTPLQLSINDDSNPGMMCFAAQRDDFAYPNYNSLNVLNYTFCTGENIRDVFTQIADKEIWDGLTHEDVHVTHAVAASPIWRILPGTIQFGNASESSLLNHTDHIAELHLSEGFILLDETWQKHMGDLEMDPQRFPTMAETVKIMRRRGFKLALTIQPYFSTESPNYISGLKKDIWVKQKLPDNKKLLHVPALTSYRGVSSVVLLDITKKGARAWIQRKLNDVIEKYGIDALFIDLGSTHDFPQYYDFGESLSTPDEYKEIFMKSIKTLSRVYAIGTTSATKLPKLPTFVAMTPTPSTWEGLKSVIPNILTMGITGFPFITPGVIGGDYLLPTLETGAPLTNGNGSVEISASEVEVPEPKSLQPNRELYIRWLELVHFLPVVQYTYLPSDYDAELVQLAQELKTIRKVKLYPYIKKAINEALTTGLPIIRPLWMSDPNDSNCLKVWDEFTIGGDILVAPILNQNSTEREIYLPKGKWRDESDGSSTKGERWIHHYRLRYNQIAYFTKLEDPAA